MKVKNKMINKNLFIIIRGSNNYNKKLKGYKV